MFELVQVSEKCFYIDAPAKIGVIKADENNVFLIDSGNDKDAGRKISKILDENSWNLSAIFNTHSNADHIGGNRYLQDKYNCKIFARGIECDFTNHPVLEPSFLYGGFPFERLRHKFLLAKESKAEPLDENKLPENLKMFGLSGHFFDMVGFETDEKIVFLADSLSSKQTLDKYGVVFIWDVAEYIKTLEKIGEIEAKLFVPSHAPVSDNVKELALYNLEKVYEVGECILNICSNGCVFEDVLKNVFDKYNLQMTFEQYVLVGSTVRSYLSWLLDAGKLEADFNNNYLYWKKINTL